MERIEQWQVHKPAVTGKRGVVASQHWRAAKAGASILEAGGNAVDAAVATALALTSCEPWMCGLGGSGYMLVYHAAEDRAEVVDFPFRVPANIDLGRYPVDPDAEDVLMGFPGVVDERNVKGYEAIAVPGAVDGFSQALERFGTMGWDAVLAPAIDLADQGLPVDWNATLEIGIAMADLARDSGARDLYLPGGMPPAPDTFLPMTNLATTLRALAEKGPRDFYEGGIAERLVADLKAGGSAIGMGDLADYRATIYDATVHEHRGARVHLAGDTTGAPRLIHALKHIERELPATIPVGVDTYLAFAGALDSAFTEHRRRQGLETDQPNSSTTHLSVIDAGGNMVALTYTLLNRFGGRVVLPATGIAMNNAISYFDPRPGFPNSLEGGKRVMSSNMCPTAVSRGGRPWFAVGASGANRIMPAVFQIAAFLLDCGLGLEEASHLPRIDAPDANGVMRADLALAPEILAALAERYTVEPAQRTVYPNLFACPSAVLHDPESGLSQGVANPFSPIAGACAAGAKAG
jgi:gamma-glutamyltranspeptidase / glutathione hydrolase